MKLEHFVMSVGFGVLTLAWPGHSRVDHVLDCLASGIIGAVIGIIGGRRFPGSAS